MAVLGQYATWKNSYNGDTPVTVDSSYANGADIHQFGKTAPLEQANYNVISLIGGSHNYRGVSDVSSPQVTFSGKTTEVKLLQLHSSDKDGSYIIGSRRMLWNKHGDYWCVVEEWFPEKFQTVFDYQTPERSKSQIPAYLLLTGKIAPPLGVDTSEITFRKAVLQSKARQKQLTHDGQSIMERYALWKNAYAESAETYIDCYAPDAVVYDGMTESGSRVELRDALKSMQGTGAMPPMFDDSPPELLIKGNLAEMRTLNVQQSSTTPF